MSKVAGHQAFVHAHLHAQALAPKHAEATLRHQRMDLMPAGSTQAMLQMYQAGAPALPTTQVRDLLTRRVSAEASVFQRMAPSQLIQRARTIGVDVRAMRAGARALLAGKGAPVAAGREAARLRYMSLQMAAASLEEGLADEDVTAMLTHVGERGGKSADDSSPQGLAELLRHAANDEEELRDALEQVLAGLDITAEDAERLADEVRRSRGSDEKLLELLRRAQKIPSIHDSTPQERQQKLREIQDKIREFERSNEGPDVLARFNVAPTAALTSSPGSFLDLYAELVSVPRTFAMVLKLLLGRYAFDAMDGVLNDLKKALGDDLSAATPSHDTRRLGAVLTDLGNMALSSSLVASVRELVGLLRRREDQRRRRRQEEAEEEQKEDAKRGKRPGSEGHHDGGK